MKKIILLFAIVFTYKTNAQLVLKSGVSISTTGNAQITLLYTDLQKNGIINQVSGTGSFLFNGNTQTLL
jgi:hypothetical protein